jgi:hypothetical protein
VPRHSPHRARRPQHILLPTHAAVDCRGILARRARRAQRYCLRRPHHAPRYQRNLCGPLRPLRFKNSPACRGHSPHRARRPQHILLPTHAAVDCRGILPRRARRAQRYGLRRPHHAPRYQEVSAALCVLCGLKTLRDLCPRMVAGYDRLLPIFPALLPDKSERSARCPR